MSQYIFYKEKEEGGGRTRCRSWSKNRNVVVQEDAGFGLKIGRGSYKKIQELF